MQAAHLRCRKRQVSWNRSTWARTHKSAVSVARCPLRSEGEDVVHRIDTLPHAPAGPTRKLPDRPYGPVPAFQFLPDFGS